MRNFHETSLYTALLKYCVSLLAGSLYSFGKNCFFSGFRAAHVFLVVFSYIFFKFFVVFKIWFFQTTKRLVENHEKTVRKFIERLPKKTMNMPENYQKKHQKTNFQFLPKEYNLSAIKALRKLIEAMVNGRDCFNACMRDG